MIRSLDGRVDPVLADYYHDGYFDHIGYIKKRHIDYVMNLVNYNNDPKAWSLSNLKALLSGNSLYYEGLRFERLNPGIIKVHRAGPNI